MEISVAPRRGASLGFWARLGIGGLVATTALIAGASPVANAEPTTGSTEANVVVSTSITLSGLTPSFSLTGLPGDTKETTGKAVAFTVKTNNQSGYKVTVVSATSALLPADGIDNGDSIPIGALSVSSDLGGWNALVADEPTIVADQSGRSLEGGSTFGNDYKVVIPFVNSDTYTATLNYVATTTL